MAASALGLRRGGRGSKPGEPVVRTHEGPLLEEQDLTCCGFFRVNELLFVYCSLIYASLIRPVSVLSLLYFLCLLIATPLYWYSRWFTIRTRRVVCTGLLALSVTLLVAQTIVTVEYLVKHQGDPTVLGHSRNDGVTFYLFSFLTRDIAVLIASALAVAALRHKQERGMTRRETPVQLLGEGSFFGTYWRQMAFLLLVLSSLIFPSLLSLPYYLAYLASFGAWALEMFSGEENRSFHRAWEKRLGYAGTVFSAFYMVVIYIFQIPIAADKVDLALLSRAGVISLVQSPDPSRTLVAILVLHTFSIFLLYALSSSVITADALGLTPTSSLDEPALAPGAHAALVVSPSQQPLPPRPPPQSPQQQQQQQQHLVSYSSGGRYYNFEDIGGEAGDGESGVTSVENPIASATVHEPLTDPSTTWRGFDPSGYHLSPKSLSYQQKARDIEERRLRQQEEQERATTPEAAAAGGGNAGGLIAQVITTAQQLVALYGLYLCALVYVVLALQRPTILGFVFMFIVIVGAVLPDFVFRSCAPLLLMFTGCYAAMVYWFGAVVIRLNIGGSSELEELRLVGLPAIDPFTDAWAIAGVPMFMTTVLGFAWRYRATPGEKASGGLLTTVFGQAEWKKYLEDYLNNHDITLYICLNLCFAVGFSVVDGLHFPFAFLSSLLIAYPRAAFYMWPIVVAYSQAFILIEYWFHFQMGSGPEFGESMALPVVFFVLACRQLALYMEQWKRMSGIAETDASHATVPLTSAAAMEQTVRRKHPTPLQRRARQAVNLALFGAKVVFRVALVFLLWHMAFHTPLNVFAVGYLLFLCGFPLIFVWSSSFNTTARREFPWLVRSISFYSCAVLSLLHLFLCDFTGVSIEQHIGAELRNYGRKFIALNWVLQLLCASQTDLLRKQQVDLAQNLRSHPFFVHALKQVLPFTLLVVIFGISYKYISLFGAVLLYMGVLNAILGRKVEVVWRVMLVLAITVSVLIVLFDMAALSEVASPDLFWLGLRRGRGIPDPDASDSGAGRGPQGWELSPSAEAYTAIAFLCALQYFYNIAATNSDATSSNLRALSPARHAERTEVSLPTSPRGGVIDNSHALAPAISVLSDILYKGKIRGSSSSFDEKHDAAHPTHYFRKAGSGGIFGRLPSFMTSRPRRMRCDVIQRCIIEAYELLHALTLNAIATCKTFSFELCVTYSVVAAVLHADLTSVVYLGLFVVLTTQPRGVLRRRWSIIVHGLALLVLAEYAVMLRLPPSIDNAKGSTARIMGSRQCSIFSQYSDTDLRSLPYTYGQWLGLCIPDHRILILDFVMLILAIIQTKRFKADKLNIRPALFARLEMKSLSASETLRAEPDADMSLGAYVTLRYMAYFNILVIFILSTLTFNMMSLGYMLLVAALVWNHAQEGVFTKRRFVWTSIAAYAWLCMLFRTLFQVPGWHSDYHTGTFEVLFGLRKVYTSAVGRPHVPPEMIFDAIILIMIVIQRRTFLSPLFQRILNELAYAEQYDYAANGFHVVNKLEKLREQSLAKIRSHISSMRDYLETVMSARVEEQGQHDRWQEFLLENRNAVMVSTRELLKTRSQEESAAMAEPSVTPLVPPPPLATPSDIDSLMDARDPRHDSGASESELRRRRLTSVAGSEKSLLTSSPRSRTTSRVPVTPSRLGSPKYRSAVVDAGKGINAVTNWVSDALQHATKLDMKDPLIADEEETSPRQQHDSPAQSQAQVDEMSGAGGAHVDRVNSFEDVLLGMDDTPAPPQPSRMGGISPPPPIVTEATHTTAHRPSLAMVSPTDRERAMSSYIDRQKTGLSKLGQLVNETVEKSDPAKLEGRAKRVGLQILQKTILVLNSRSTSMVYGILIAAHMYQPSLLSLIYPISVFGYGLLQNPRSLPRIAGSLIHPMVQNPPRHFWNFLLTYSFAMLVIKFIFQFPLFCVCANQYSSGYACPSSLEAYEDVCAAKTYPKLDYYVRQPIVYDYFVGVYKASHFLPWHFMSLRFEPVRRFLPANPPGMTSDRTLNSGLQGVFLLSFLGDFLVLLAVLWHTHVLRVRGVWLSRDPELFTDQTEVEDRPSAKGKPRGNTHESGTSFKGHRHLETMPEETEEVLSRTGTCQDVDHVGSSHTQKLSPTHGLTVVKTDKPPSRRKRSLTTSLANRFLREWCMACVPRLQPRTKPGCDLYVPLFFTQCLLFIYVLFAYQQAEHLVQSVRENQLSGSFILVLLLHFVFIVIDRVLYLHKAVKGKIALQIFLLVCVYSVIHSSYTFRVGINQHGPLFVWYLIMCVYFIYSALQISYGYPPHLETNWMTKRAHHMWGNFFRIYRAIPFTYELKIMLDWSCTSTTLFLGEWIKLEDIYSGLFVAECNLHFMHEENRRKGTPQPGCRKVRTGFLFFVLLNLLVWLPLFVFSTGSFSKYDNYISSGSLSVGIAGYPTLYAASSADYISPILPSETWTTLAQAVPPLGILPATSTNDYSKELQYVRLPVASQAMWEISPPAERDLLKVLRTPNTPRPPPPSSSTASGKEDTPPTFVAAPPGQVDMALHYQFKTQDGVPNSGQITRSLTDIEKLDLAQVITGNRSSVTLQAFMPSAIRISATREVTPLLTSDADRLPCVLTLNRVGAGSMSVAAEELSPPGSAIVQGGLWWEVTCGCALAKIMEDEKFAVDAAVEEDGGTAREGDKTDCEPSIFTIASQKTIGSYFSIGYGILGLYFTVVFTVGRFVHMSVVGMKNNVIYEDLPTVEVLKELCKVIYLARMYKNLPLEEELYRELIDIYRRPQLLYERTGPFKHWYREPEEESGKTAYELNVERELEKYR